MVSLAGGVILFFVRPLQVFHVHSDGIRSILLLPLLGVGLTGFLMFLINIPMAAINTGLNNFLSSLSGSSAVLLGLLVGGMMAVDMGGPVNLPKVKRRNEKRLVTGTQDLVTVWRTG